MAAAKALAREAAAFDQKQLRSTKQVSTGVRPNASRVSLACPVCRLEPPVTEGAFWSDADLTWTKGCKSMEACDTITLPKAIQLVVAPGHVCLLGVQYKRAGLHGSSWTSCCPCPERRGMQLDRLTVIINPRARCAHAGLGVLMLVCMCRQL